MNNAQDSERIQQAVHAIRAGQLAQAKALLADVSDPPPLLIAQLCQRLGDTAGERQALARILTVSPRDLPALLAMADLNERLGDLRAASSFYRTALAQAAVTPPPQALHGMLEHGRKVIAQSSEEFATHLSDVLTDRHLPPRISQAIDLLMGRRELYFQQPAMFYFPGLPQRDFYERGEFDWVEEMESRTPALRDELDDVLATGHRFRPYVETRDDRPPPNNHLRDDESWGAHYFIRNGEIEQEASARCPQTMAALALADMPRIPNRSPMALWSALRPGTHIKPHHGLLNTRLICHLPLLTPEGCALRCGATMRTWEKGRMLIFDDSVEHEAWNRGESLRVILLFEIWRPEIGPAEREALSLIFSAIDSLADEG
jgi:hypothetical protein